ncbi:MAG: M48 family metalloprotease [Pirellula sp.]
MSNQLQSMELQCPACNAKLNANRSHIGKRLRCAKCKFEFDLSSKPSKESKVTAPPRQASSIDPPRPKPELNVVPPPIQQPSQSQSRNSRLPFIHPSQLQVDGESLVLFGTLAVAILVGSMVTFATLLVFAILLLVFYFLQIGHFDAVQRNAIKSNEQADKWLKDLLEVSAKRLTIPTPLLFVTNDMSIGAFAFHANGRNVVVLNLGLVRLMTAEELQFVIGHELTHIKCGHCKYLLLTNSIVGSSFNRLFALFFHLLFMLWSRKAEFTCDRGGLVACKDPMAAMTALAKVELSSLATNQEAIHSFVQGSIRGAHGIDSPFATHPMTAKRIESVHRFSQTRQFHQLSSLWI